MRDEQATGGEPPLRTSRVGDVDWLWDERVLRPRPWTRHQAGWAAGLLATMPPGPVVELCCGVGHIGLLTVRATSRRGVLVDADPVACSFARRNARRAGVAELVTIVEHHLDGAPVPAVPTVAPLVLADPPYLPTPMVERFPDDPPHAVDGRSEDGLGVVGQVLASASAHVMADGVILLQVGGATQAGAVAGRLVTTWAALGLDAVEVAEFGVDRAVMALHPRR
jgi:methylase of polypeptide subunit release factors